MTKLLRLAGAAFAAALGSASPAAAATILAQSTFDTGAEGWVEGDFTGGNRTHPLTWDSRGHVLAIDAYGQVAGFLAPIAFRGDKRDAFGGTLSFDLASDLPAVSDDLPYVTLRRDGLLLFGLLTNLAPNSAFRRYSVELRPENFVIGDPESNPTVTPATAEQLRRVLTNITQLSIRADVANGRDAARLDNVVLTASAAVPEPATWAMMITGFGLSGAIMRRRSVRAMRLTPR